MRVFKVIMVELVEEDFCEEKLIEVEEKGVDLSSFRNQKVNFKINVKVKQKSNTQMPVVVNKEEKESPKEKKEEKEDIGFDDNFAFLYYKLAGKDEQLDAFELQSIMAMVFRTTFPKNSDFSLETCRSMVSSMDTYKIAKLNYVQFKNLWTKIVKWVYTFEQSQRDSDRKIDFSELCIALSKLNVKLNKDTIRTLVNRFHNKSGLIELDDFIQICCKAESVKSSYERVRKGDASFEVFFTEIMRS